MQIKRMIQPPLRIAWFSPLAGAHYLRSAAYTAAVIDACPAHWEIEVFVGDEDLKRAGEQKAAIYHYHRFFEQARRKEFDAVFYNLENHARARFVALCGARFPGISLFHQSNLFAMERSAFRHATGPTDLNNLMDDLFGPDSVRLGDYHVRGWPIEAFLRIYRTAEPGLRYSAAAAFFSTHALRAAKGKHPALPLHLLYNAVELQETRDQDLERKKLHIDQDAFVLGYSGTEKLNHRFHTVMAALQASRRKTVLLWLLPDEEQLPWVEEELNRDETSTGMTRVVLLRIANKEALAHALSSCDLFLGLELDQDSSLSVSAATALALGLPLVSLATGLPSAAAFRIEPGFAEAGELCALLNLLQERPELLSTVGAQGREYARRELSPRRAVQELEACLREDADVLAAAAKRKKQDYRAAKERLFGGLKDELAGVNPWHERPEMLWDAAVSAAIKDLKWEAE